MKAVLAICFLSVASVVLNAQTASNDPWPFPDRKRRDDESHIVKEMLAKQQSAKEKKEYEELLEKGAAALELSEQLEKAFSDNESLTDADRRRLEEFEKLVEKIRKDLGGDDDGETSIVEKDDKDPKDVREGFLYLKRATQGLVGEIKKSTRFSVSVVAIESSNTLIRLARFLRLKS